MHDKAGAYTESKDDCEFKAEAGGGPEIGGMVQVAERRMHINNLMAMCMRTKGWTQVRG